MYKIRRQRRGNRYQKENQQNRVNSRIRAREVLVIDEDNNQLGVMSPRAAIERAEEVGLDLVEVSPNATPPVCRIMDYGKFQYEKSKRAKEAKKKQAVVRLKEVQFSFDTAEHDYQFKKRHVQNFLSHGWKVRAKMTFLGREIVHADLGRKMLDRLASDVAEIGEIEQPPKMETHTMLMILAPKSS